MFARIAGLDSIAHAEKLILALGDEVQLLIPRITAIAELGHQTASDEMGLALCRALYALISLHEELLYFGTLERFVTAKGVVS